MNTIFRTILLGIAALALVLVACTPGAPAPGEPAPADPGAPAAPDVDATLAALCDPTNETGLANVATELEMADETTDTTALSTLIGTAMANLQTAQVEPGQEAARDAAVTALGQVQTALADPATLSAAALEAATALRAAETTIC